MGGDLSTAYHYPPFEQIRPEEQSNELNFYEKLSKSKKRKRNLFVHVLHKAQNKTILCHSFAVTAKKCIKRSAPREKMLFR